MSSDTSMVFNLLGRDKGIGKLLGVIGGAFRSAGQNAETAMDKAAHSTEKLEKQLDQTKRKVEQLDGATAKAAVQGEAAQLRLNAAREKYNAILEKEGATENQKAQALNRVKAAELAVAAAAERTNKIQADRGKATAAISRLEEAIRRAEDGTDNLGDSSNRTGSILSRLAGFAGNAWSSLSGLGGSLASVASSIPGLIAVIGALAGVLASIGPAVSLAGGALGSLPAIITGGIAAIGTLKLGLFGLSDEYKRLTTVTTGGGGAAQAAKQMAAANRAVEQAVRAVARAERDVQDAQKDALAAQQAINDAREDATLRMRDQASDLKQARLDEADAVDDLETAQTELNDAIASGDPEKIDDAQRAYDRAALAVERAKTRTQDLTKANEENTKKGVEGSDEVAAAKTREEEARRRVADAQQAEADAEQRLADARKTAAEGSGGGGGGGAAERITKLAPAAREFLNTIIGLRPAFERLRLHVQEKLFAGLGDKVQTLAERWMPQLKATLGGFAGTFNGIAKTFLTTASKKSFIENMGAGAESARKALDRVGNAVAGPLTDAFGRLARASGPFVERIGNLLGRALENFSAWIKKADESGKLDKFFKDAADTLERIWDLGGNVVEVVGKFIGIIFPQAKGAGDSVLDGANITLGKISAWLDKPENQQKIRDIISGIGQIVTALGSAGTAVGKFVGSASKAWTGLKNGVTGAYDWVKDRTNKIVNWVGALPGRIGKAARGMFDGIKNAFRGALNWVISKWNNLSFSIGGGSFLGVDFPSFTLGTPNVDYLAKGGIVPATPGGRLAVIGEGGEDEAVIPLSKLGQMGGGRQEIVIRLDFGDSEFGRAMARAVRTQPAVASAIKQHLKISVAT